MIYNVCVCVFVCVCVCVRGGGMMVKINQFLFIILLPNTENRHVA